MSPDDEQCLLYLVAGVLVICFGAGIAFTLDRSDWKQEIEKQESAADSHEPTRSHKDEGTTPQSANIEENPINKHSESEASFQERQIRVAAGLNIITVGAAIVALIGLYVLYGTLDASRTQLQTAQQQLELSERPWVALEMSVVRQLEFTNGAGTMFVKVALKNIGNSVAINVKPTCRLGAPKLEPLGFEAVFALESKACDTLGDQSDFDPHFGNILFPNEPLTQGEVVGVSESEISDAIRASSAWAGRPIIEFTPFLVCCVDYRSVLDKKHHQTRRVYEFGDIDQTEPPGMWTGIIPKGIAEHAVLVPWFEGNSAD